MEEAKTLKKELHVTYIDLARAYDSIPLEGLYETLSEYGFPEKVVQLIKTMYKDNEVSIITEYGNTDPIPVKQGVRQGDKTYKQGGRHTKGGSFSIINHLCPPPLHLSSCEDM